MPVKHSQKQYYEDAYYHVYNKGVNGGDIFLDDQDYTEFLLLLERYLSRRKQPVDKDFSYESYAGRLELVAYCLTTHRFDLLFYLNNDTKAITELMRRVCTTYTMYFNKKYKRSGPLFHGVYKARLLENDVHVLHVTRHLHRMPVDYYQWPYSSIRHYISDEKSEWVVPDRVYRMYEWGTYENYLNNHEDYKILNQHYDLD
jgi:putative transposase